MTHCVVVSSPTPENECGDQMFVLWENGVPSVIKKVMVDLDTSGYAGMVAQVVRAREVLEEQPPLAQTFGMHEVHIVHDRNEHLLEAMHFERLLNE